VGDGGQSWQNKRAGKGQVSITGTSGGACKGNCDFVWGSEGAGEGQVKGR
jgi:hypothetical protein